jgi:3-oxoacyl-[acyl-carrier-protein] synthase-3
MIGKHISGIKIAAITASIPSKILDSEFFSTLYGEKEVARVTRGTGIGSIRSGVGLTTADMVEAAASQLLCNVSLDKSDIDGLIVVTQTPDDWSPGTAFAIHQRFGLSTNCFLVDINSGCAGYVNGLIQAASLVASGTCSNVLLCTGDINTRLVDDDDQRVRMLFGDAASATLVTRGRDALHFIYGADGSGRSHLGVQMNYEKRNKAIGTIDCLKMDGAAVMSFALRRVPEVLTTLLSEKGIQKDDIDLFALHQPNEFILKYIRKILNLSENNLPVDVDGIGNTNSSSIPLLLSRRDWENERGRRNIVLCGFGVGLAWNALHLDLSHTKIIKPVELAEPSLTSIGRS